MTAELQVLVEQSPGTVNWNFEQLKDSLEALTEGYQNLIYTEDNIQLARKDLSALKGLRDAVEEKRKEIRRNCLEPYLIIETQARELTALIDGPIAEISSQLTAFTEKQREERRNIIQNYMQECFSDLPEPISKKLAASCYDTRWENATMRKKTWMEAITAAHNRVAAELKALEGVDPDFQDMAMEAYEQNLSIGDALNKVKELRHQRDRLREQLEARARLEHERAQKVKEAAQMNGQAEESAAERTERAAPTKPADNPALNGLSRDTGKNVGPEQEPRQNAENTKEQRAPGLRTISLKVTGNENQLARIKAFIRYTGASYEEV